MQGPSYSNDSNNFNNNKLKSNINELSGILPRTARFIFSEFGRLSKFDHNYKLFISAVEIYNENIYDLFCVNSHEKTPLSVCTTKNNVRINISYLNIIYIYLYFRFK